MTLLLNPGFEDGTQCWTWSVTGAERSADYGSHNGDYAARLRFRTGSLGPPPVLGISGTVTQRVALRTGATYALGAWLRRQSGAVALRMDVLNPADDAAQEADWTNLATATAATAWTEIGGSFVALGREVDVRFRAFAGEDGYLLVDDAGLEEDTVARLLTERGTLQLLKCLQDNLATEIGYINTERADGLTVPATANWFGWRREIPANRGFEVEVYEDGPSTFPFNERDESAYAASARPPVTIDVPVALRATVPNISGWTNAQMLSIARRVGAALTRVVLNNPQLGDSTHVVRAWCRDLDVLVDDEVAEDGRRTEVARVLLRVDVRTEESSSGEMTSGAAPAATVESVA